MKTRRTFLALGLAAGVATLFAPGRRALAHGDAAHPAQRTGPVVREQQDWGIAGEAKAVRRTIPITVRAKSSRRSPMTLIGKSVGKTSRVSCSFMRASRPV